MSIIKRISLKIFLTISILLSFITILLITISVLLTSKPQTGLSIIDKLFIDSYEISSEFIQIDNLLTTPSIFAKNVSISSDAQQIKIEEIAVQFDLFNLILNKNLFFKRFHLVGYEATNLGESDDLKSNDYEYSLINGHDLKIKTNQLNLISSKFSIEHLGGNNSIQLNNGNINDINFSTLDVLINKNNKIFYKGTHNLFAEDLNKLGIIKSSDFKHADIKTSILSRGSIDPSDPIKNKTFYKIDIFNSNLTFNSGYLVSDINSSLYTDLNGGLYGSFSSSLPLQDAIQDINGSVLYIRNKGLELISSFNIDMEKLINPNPYFSLSGKESFETSFKITPEQKLTLTLNTDLQETYIFSTIDEISKPLGKPLFTSIKIPSLVDPTYEISNESFKAYIGHAGEEGYFIFGDYGGNIKEKDGFHIYLDLDLFDFSSVRFDATAEGESFVKTISLRAKEFKMLNNSFVDQFINLNFKKSGLFGNFKGSDLNGELIVDNTGFLKVILNKTTIENLNFISRTSQVTSNINDSSLINMRIQGSEISIAGENFESIDFYVLRNKNLITIEDINITSDYINIYPLDSGENAFVSYSSSDDLYKIKGSFEIDGSSKFIKDSLNYDFDFLNTELSIQWNSIEELINLEGKVKFLTKDFTVENDISSSAFLNALKILNLDAIIKNIDSNRSSSRDSLFLTRASGNIIFSTKRGLISNPISIETDEAKMLWVGEIVKNNDGYLSDLNLDMSMRIKVSENLPWYAAILGGIPAVAGTLVFQDLFEENIDAASSIAFKVDGTIEEPVLKRLN